MQLTVETFTVHKKFALRISRGTTAQSTNLLLRIRSEEVEGWGEASPFSIDKSKPKNSLSLLTELKQIIPFLEPFHPLQRQEIDAKLKELNVSSSVQAAVDIALYDWLGKKAGLPLWQIWGLNCDRIVPISVTIGISTPSEALARLQDWQKTLDFKMLKLKLGSPAGIEADKLMVEAICHAAPDMRITVDANGGWNLPDAIYMSQWLADRSVEYIEQPLPVALDAQLSELSEASPLPIFVDESCFTSADIPRLANAVAGVNLKI
ncbi:MAG: enolase C-terminal domain-like protein, partial [Cyanobacteria bacterium J06633_1]